MYFSNNNALNNFQRLPVNVYNKTYSCCIGKKHNSLQSTFFTVNRLSRVNVAGENRCFTGSLVRRIDVASESNDAFSRTQAVAGSCVCSFANEVHETVR